MSGALREGAGGVVEENVLERAKGAKKGVSDGKPAVTETI